jgi:hypothetical protein
MGIIHRFTSIEDGEFRWQDVSVSAYGPENSRADLATRQILIGMGDAHDHGVYILHGRARLRLGDEEHELQTGDVVYIPGNEMHQFFTVGDEPFGFLCVVPAKR